MGIPQVSDRFKEAPAHALRAVFSGFGQLLLAAERLRSQAGEQATSPAPPTAAAPRAPAPAPAAPAAEAGPSAGQATGAGQMTGAGPATPNGKAGGRKRDRDQDPAADRWRSLDQTGNVRILSPDDPAEDPVSPSAASDLVAPAPTPAPVPAPPIPVAADPADPAGTASAALPVPGYDGLSLPSLRARLRSLDAGQLRVLIAYEHEHADRADVVAMFERRIAKLAAG